jgi:PAN domain
MASGRALSDSVRSSIFATDTFEGFQTTVFSRQSGEKRCVSTFTTLTVPEAPMKLALILAATLFTATATTAQQPAQTPNAQPTKAAPSMERFQGVWVEGGGFNITYGGNYDACAAKCLATAKCVMIEYYRPEKKCNMYDAERPRLKGGMSDVALKR